MAPEGDSPRTSPFSVEVAGITDPISRSFEDGVIDFKIQQLVTFVNLVPENHAELMSEDFRITLKEIGDISQFESYSDEEGDWLILRKLRSTSGNNGIEYFLIRPDSNQGRFYKTVSESEVVESREKELAAIP